MEPAGTIVTEQPDSDDYRKCDGTWIEGWRYPDYKARVGGALGAAGIDMFRLPIAPGFSIRVRDDPAAADPPPDGWSYDNLPPPYQLWINPVPDGVADGTGAAMVRAEAHIEPVVVTCAAQLVNAVGDPTDIEDIEMLADGTINLAASVEVGDGWHFRLWSVERPDIVAQSNDFQITGA